MIPSRIPPRNPRRSRLGALLLPVILALVACGGTTAKTATPADQTKTAKPSGTIALYTSYNQPEVDAVVAAYRASQPGVKITVFRAPTGQLTARIAAEQRSGGVRADVLLLSDPLTMHAYDAQGMLLQWNPPDASAVPAEAHSTTFWGVTTSDIVAIHRRGVRLASWHDLTSPRLRGAVGLPDPNFAGSAFGVLGYFALADGYGLDFYRQLKANGAVQVQAPGDVIAGVAQRKFQAGMVLDFLARAAIAKGSPIEISAPDPGAVRLYAPVAVLQATKHAAAAKSFANFLLTSPAQQALARLDRHPIRDDVPATAPAMREVVPDWPAIFDREKDLRSSYQSIFGA